jgi:hypothetical protein
VVKYGLPRFFGMTKTFRPFFRVCEVAPEDELVVLDDELHAASTEEATTSTARLHSTRLSEPLIVNPFNLGAGHYRNGPADVRGPCGDAPGRA